MAEPDLRYKAFLSYSHAGDKRLAAAIQTALQRFARPWNRVRALRVFRDEASLSANPDLWRSIQNALAQSEFFVLLASPQAAASEWVAREIAFWRAEKPARKLLMALTEGEIVWERTQGDFDWGRTTALPLALRQAFPEEPLHVDLRWARSVQVLSLDDPRFRGTIADLAAPLHGRPKDELIGEDIFQHRRSVRFRLAAAAALIILAIGAAGAGATAYWQRSDSLASQSRVLASLSRQKLDAGDTVSAMRLALEALPAKATVLERPLVGEAESALYAAVLAHRQVAALMGHRDAVTSIAFSGDGRRIITASRDKTARVWDAETGRSVAVLGEHDRPVTVASFCGADDQALTVSEGGIARIWVLGRSEPVKRFSLEPPPEPESRLFESLESLEALPLVLTTNFLQRIRFPDRQFEVFVSRDCRHVAAKFFDARTVLWDTTTRQAVSTIGIKLDWLLAAALDERNKRVATRSLDGKQHIWDAATGSRLTTLHARTPQESGRDAMRGLQQAFAAVQSSAPLFKEGALDSFPDLKLPFTTAAFTRDGRLFASSANATALVVDARTGRQKAVLRGHEALIVSIDFSPDGARVLTGAMDGTARVWNAASGELIFVLRRTEPVLHARFSPDGELIATVSGAAYLWSARDGQPISLFRDPLSAVTQAVFDPRGGRIVTGSESGGVGVWSTQRAHDRAVERVLRGHSGTVMQASFAADGHRIVTASADGTTRMWDARTGETSSAFSPAGNGTALPGNAPVQVIHAELSRDGKRLLVHARDGKEDTVSLWDVDGRRRIATLEPGTHSNYEYAGIGSDGRTLILRTRDRIVAIDPESAAQIREHRIEHGRWEGWAASSHSESVVMVDERGTVTLDTMLEHRYCEPGEVELPVKSADDQRRGAGRIFVAVSDDGNAIVVGLQNGALHLFAGCASFWGPTHRVLLGHTGAIEQATFGPAGRLLTTSRDGSSRLWDYRTGRLLGALPPTVRGVFSPDGLHLVSSLGEVWDMQAMVKLASLPLPWLFSQANRDWHFAWSPDGTRVVSSGQSEDAYVFRIYTHEELVARARELLAGGASPPGPTAQ